MSVSFLNVVISVLLICSQHSSFASAVSCDKVFTTETVDGELLTHFKVKLQYSEQNTVINARVHVSGNQELSYAALSLEGNSQKAKDTYRNKGEIEYLIYFNASLRAPVINRIEVGSIEKCLLLCVGDEDHRPNVVKTYMSHRLYPFGKSVAGTLNCTDYKPLSDSIPTDCGVSLVPRIYGGEDLTRGSWPWLVVIYEVNYDGIKFRCGGTIITSQVVLTAAHCLTTGNVAESPENILTFVGRYDLSQFSERDYVAHKAKRIVVHPNYTDGQQKHDIGLLITEEPILFNNITQPACLWRGPTNLEDIVNKSGVVAGWGRKEDGRVSSVPQYIDARIAAEDECRRSNENFEKLDFSHIFCAGNMDDTGPCSGDSGGALILEDSVTRRYTVRGVVSASLQDQISGRCDLKNLVLYTDVAKHLNWIESEIP